MDIKKFKEVLEDKDFLQSLVQLETPQQVQQALANKDIDLSIEEITSIRDLIERYDNNELTDEEKKAFATIQNSNSDELNDEQLESVSGGSILVMGLMFLACTAVVAAGFAPLVHQETRGRW